MVAIRWSSPAQLRSTTYSNQGIKRVYSTSYAELNTTEASLIRRTMVGFAIINAMRYYAMCYAV